MSCYFVARIAIHDRAGYGIYEDGFDDVFAPYHGEVLAVDDAPELLEGEWNATRMVLIRFPSRQECRRWYDSPEYQKLARHRWNSSHADILLVHGRD